MSRVLDEMFQFAAGLVSLSVSTENMFGAAAERLFHGRDLLQIDEADCTEALVFIDSIRKSDRFRALACSTFLARMQLVGVLPRTQARFYKLHGLLALNLRLSQESYVYSHKSIDIFLSDRDSSALGSELAEAYSQAGTAARNLGQPATALSDFLAAHRIATQNGTSLLAAWQLFRLGKMYLNYLEQPSRGFKFFVEARAKFETIGTPSGNRGKAACLDEIGDIYRQNVGNTEKAREYYREAQTINEGLNNMAGISRNLAHLGLCAEASGDFASAKTFMAEAIALLRALPGESRGVGIRLGQEARIHLELRNLSTAEARLQEATEISLAYRDHKAQAQHELVWAKLRRIQGRSSDSREHLNRAVALASQYQLHTIQVAALEAQAEISRDDFADYQTARELLLTSASVKLSAWEDIRASNPSLEEVEDKNSIADMYRSLFERLLEDYRSTLSRTTDAAALAFNIALEERDKRFTSALGLFRFGAYTATIGHDLKNLAQGVNSQLAGLLAKERLSDSARSVISSARHKLSEGVSKLGTPSILQGIALARNEPETSDLEPILRLLCSTYSNKASAVGLSFKHAGLPEVATAKGNRVLLQVVLTTLLDNALEALHGRPDGTITVRFDLETGANGTKYLLCQVFDTGDGIDEENRKRMFELGFTTKEGHSGFGLPTMFFLLDSIGGAVSCESKRGSGTRFSIRFPVNEARSHRD